MNLLSSVAALLGFEVEAITDRVKRTIIVNTIVAVFAAIGVSFLLAAGFFALTTIVGPIYAALIFGGVFVLLALAVFLGTKLGEGERQRQAAAKRRSSETGAFMTTAALTALPVLLKSPAIRNFGLPAAAIAAFLLARKSDAKDD